MLDPLDFLLYWVLRSYRDGVVPEGALDACRAEGWRVGGAWAERQITRVRRCKVWLSGDEARLHALLVASTDPYNFNALSRVLVREGVALADAAHMLWAWGVEAEAVGASAPDAALARIARHVRAHGAVAYPRSFPPTALRTFFDMSAGRAVALPRLGSPVDDAVLALGSQYIRLSAAEAAVLATSLTRFVDSQAPVALPWRHPREADQAA